MADFMVSGLTSGIDYAELIDQLVALKRAPIDRLEEKKNDYQEKLRAYETLASKLEDLQSAADTLRKSSTFEVKQAEVDDETVLSATASSSAQTGTYTISDITALAQAHKITHDTGWADKDTTPVSSTGGYFSWKVGSSGTEYTVTVTTSMTLEELASAINSANGGIKATIINDGSSNPYRLVLTSEDSGAANNIIITQDDTDLDTATNGFSVELQAAQDASFKVDGLSVTKSTNTISDVISGVTFTLKKATGSGNSYTLTVSNDVETIKSNIKALIDAYNEVINHINSESEYDTESHEGGPLFNESTTRSIIRRLRSIITTGISGLSEDTKLLAQVGVKTNRDGTLSLDESELEDKLNTDYDDVKALFIYDTDTGIEGVAKKLYDELDDITDFAEGAITIRKEGIQKIIDKYTKEIEEEEAELDRYEESLRIKFAALEALLTTFKTQSSSLAGLI